jgi:catalase
MPPILTLEEAWVGNSSQDDEDYYSQAGDLFRIMTAQQRDQLAATIAGGLRQATTSAQDRMLSYIACADKDYAEKVMNAL